MREHSIRTSFRKGQWSPVPIVGRKGIQSSRMHIPGWNATEKMMSDMSWGWGGGQGHVREPSKDTEKGDGMMKLCVNEAQSGCWGQWCCYQSGSEDQEVTWLNYGGNTRDGEKSSNAGASGGKLLAHSRSDLLKRWEREGISGVSNSTPKFYFNRSSHCHRQVQISAQ